MPSKLILTVAVAIALFVSLHQVAVGAETKEINIDVNAVVDDEQDMEPTKRTITEPVSKPPLLRPGKTVSNKPSAGVAQPARVDSEAAKEPAREAKPGTDLPPETISDDDLGGQLALPEITMRAKLSSSDVNRVVCKQEIKDVIFSKEKDVVVKYSGKNAFIKFKVARQGSDFKYPTDPVELFVVCGDLTYNLIALPKKIPSQTIRLDSGKTEKIAKNVGALQGQAVEKKVIGLIKAAMTDLIPDSYTIEVVNKPAIGFAEVMATLIRTVAVDGEGLVLKEFMLKANADVELVEKRFLSKDYSDKPLAIAFERLKLKKNERGRLFIVESKGLTTPE